MAWGLEARVPFLDKTFLDVAMSIDAKYKTFNKGFKQETDVDGRPKMEKARSRWSFMKTRTMLIFCPGFQYILRKAFDISPEGGKVLPFFSRYLNDGLIRLLDGQFS
jgi:asparagine synthase (glutamine-hydrolysing)